MSGSGQSSGAARMGGNVLALLVARVLAIILSFVQASVIVSSLGRGGMGHFSYAWGLTSLLTVFATLGVRRVLIRGVARETGSGWPLVWTATGMVFALSLMVTALLFVAEWGMDGVEPRRAAVMMAAVWIVVLWAWQQPFEGLLMARERMVLTAILQVAVAALKVAAVLWMVSDTATAAEAHGALALATLIGLGLFIGASVRTEGWSSPSFSGVVLRRLLRECRPMLAATILSLIYFKSDIVLLGWLRGEDATGIYGAVQRISEPTMMMAAVLGAALFPALCRYAAVADGNLALLRRTSARLVLLVSVPMAFGLAAVAEPVIGLLARDRASEFAASVTILQCMCIVIPFFYFNGVALEFLYAVDENWFVAKTYALAAVISVAGNLVLIPRLGVFAVPLTATAVNAMISACYYGKLRVVLKEARLAGLLVKTVSVSAAMGLLAWWLSRYSLALAVASGVVTYLLLQWTAGTLSPLEKELAAKLSTRLTQRLRTR